MKNGFRVMDSDLHTMEPDGLWERYLDEPFKRFAPKFIRGTDHAPNQPIIKIGGLDIGEMSKRPRTAVVGKDLQRRAFARSPHYDVAHARGYDAASHVQAMDIEGVAVAILHGTRGRPRARLRPRAPGGGDGHGGDRRRDPLRHARPPGAHARRPRSAGGRRA